MSTARLQPVIEELETETLLGDRITGLDDIV